MASNSPEHALVSDAWRILDALDLAEIDRRIEFLETALVEYKSLAAIKRIEARRPAGLVYPPLTIPLTDLDAAARGRAPRRSADEMIELVSAFLDGGPRKTADIAAHVGCKRATIEQHLSSYHHRVYVRVGRGLWALRHPRPATSDAATMPA